MRRSLRQGHNVGSAHRSSGLRSKHPRRFDRLRRSSVAACRALRLARAGSPDGTRIVTGPSDNTARAWDAKTFSVFGILNRDATIADYRKALSVDARMIGSGSSTPRSGSRPSAGPRGAAAGGRAAVMQCGLLQGG